MQHRPLLLATTLFALSGGPASAQWADDFDSYPINSFLVGVSAWDEWDGNIASSETQIVNAAGGAPVRSAPHSISVGGTSDTLYEFPPGVYTSGQWTLSAHQYLPALGSMIEPQYFYLMNQYDHFGPYNWSVQVEMNPLTGNYTLDTAAGSFIGPCAFEQWVELRSDIDLDADTVSFYYAGNLVATYPWNGGVSGYGSGSNDIASVNMFAGGSPGSTSLVYYDDFSLAPTVPPVQPIEFSGLRHLPEGNAVLTHDTNNNTLIVSNIGSSGLDGVKILANDAPESVVPPGAHGIDVEWAPTLLGISDSVVMTGSNAADGQVAYAKAERTGATTVELFVTFPFAGPTKTIDLYRDGVLVACYTGVTPSTFAVVDVLPLDSPLLGAGLAWRWDPLLKNHTNQVQATWSLRHRYNATIAPNFLVTVGSNSELADEIVATSGPILSTDFAFTNFAVTPSASLTILKDGLREFGSRHFVEGDASWNLDDPNALVENLGTSGLDGLRILLDHSVRFAIDWADLVATSTPAILRQEWIGFSSTPGETIATLEVRETAPSVYECDVDFLNTVWVTAEFSLCNLTVSPPMLYSGDLTGMTLGAGSTEFEVCPGNVPSLRVVLDGQTNIDVPSVGSFCADEIVFTPGFGTPTAKYLEELLVYGTNLTGLELEDEERPSVAAWTTYCTSGTSSYGCTPSIGAIGVPSASATSGFELTVCGVHNDEVAGVFFYGWSGRKLNTTWGNTSSFFCVEPPVKRSGIVMTAGQPTGCEGTASNDLAAFWTLKPQHQPPVGSTVQAQFWYRDPGAPGPLLSQMTDAIEFVLCP